jgi:hypothetical protein
MRRASSGRSEMRGRKREVVDEKSRAEAGYVPTNRSEVDGYGRGKNEHDFE